MSAWPIGALAAAAVAVASPVHMLAPGVISTAGNAFGGTMTPDGKEIYFSRSVPRSYMYAIFMSRKAGGRWTRPVLAPFSGRGRDFDPVISPDGRTLVFISDRPVKPGQAKHDYDVWQVERTAMGRWSAAHNLGLPVNTEKPPTIPEFGFNEWFASLAGDGALYVASDGYEPQARMAIYRLPRVGGVYQAPEKLGPTINGEGVENGEPIVAPDESFLLFSSYGRKDGYGGWDIYISLRQPDGNWGPAKNLGPAVNTSARDYSPRLEPDHHTLVFTSERNFTTGRLSPVTWRELRKGVDSLQSGSGKLYEVDLCALSLRLPACP